MDKIFNNNMNDNCDCDDTSNQINNNLSNRNLPMNNNQMNNVNTNFNNVNNNQMNNLNNNGNNNLNNNGNNNQMNNGNNNQMNNGNNNLNNNGNNNLNNNGDIEEKRDNMCYVKLIVSILIALGLNEMIKFFINQSIRLNKGTSARYIYYPLVCIVILIFLCMR